MENKIVDFADFRPQTLFPGESSFELTVGGTTYEVSTHFDPDGRETVLDQFMTLLRKRSFT